MNPRDSKSKIKSPPLLKKTLQKLRKSGAKRVVFTNGCFDILHKGHVHYLQEARGNGDLLVVALDTDASVRKLKGPSRPINKLKDRLEVLAALECVDFVTWFHKGNPRSIVLELKPEVLVKGGDWKPDQIIGAKEVLSWGGSVLSLSFVKGKSTTKIIERAQFR